MRTILVLLGTASMLAACSGGSNGAQSLGSAAPPTSSSPTPTPTDVYSQFTSPTQAQTYKGIGGSQSFEYSSDGRVAAGQQGQLYAGDATTVRDSGITISYDPRDAIFTLTVSDPKSNTNTDTRFQDPGSRTDFANSTKPQWGTPDLANLPAGATANTHVNYLQASDGDPLSRYGFGGSGLIDPGNNSTPADGTSGSSYLATTFFYEKPGTTTKYVTFAGYVRNSISIGTLTITPAGGGAATTAPQDLWHLERGAFAYGAQTQNSAVPTGGTASYSGEMLGTMVYNPTLDDPSPQPTYFQWLTGTSKVTVDFGAKTVGLQVDGFVLAPQIDRYTTPTTTVLDAGSTFTGTGSATIDLVGKGGFSGMFSAFSFTDTHGAKSVVNIAGSSIDGAFFGPKAEEVGGGFRVVGGTPDQRIDVLGAFTAKK